MATATATRERRLLDEAESIIEAEWIRVCREVWLNACGNQSESTTRNRSVPATGVVGDRFGRPLDCWPKDVDGHGTPVFRVTAKQRSPPR